MTLFFSQTTSYVTYTLMSIEFGNLFNRNECVPLNNHLTAVDEPYKGH